MKKLILLLIAVMLCFSLVACGNDEVDNKANVENTNELIASGESENDDGVKYEFKENTVEIDYAGMYKVVYHIENDIVTICETIYEFDTEEEAKVYESTASYAEGTTITRDGTVVTISSDFTSQNLSRTTIEEIAKTISSK